MCGAPVFPAIPTTRFVHRPRAASASAAADVVDAAVGGSPPPSTPSSGWSYSSSLETGAPPHDTLGDTPADSVAAYAAAALLSLQHQLMAEATRGLLAATQQMAARPPDRQSAATRRAPVPPPIDTMRFVVPNTMPMVMPAADVMDAGSSAPSTPSHCSSSFDTTTPSPRSPLPPSLPPDSAAAAACASHHPLTPAWRLATKPPLPLPPVPAPRVEVRQVWAHNFEEEAKLIESLLPKFPYVAIDTKFPGTVYRPEGPAYTLKPDERYNLLRCTVDALDPIQLGLTLFDADEGSCRLPSLTGGAMRYVWEFNFREFDDVGHHRHASASIAAALRAGGEDLDRTRRRGVDAAAKLGPRLRKWVRARAGLGCAGVVTASGGYDLAYLVKMMLGPGFRMPASAAEFEAVAGALLRRRKVFDVREMARRCPGDELRRGLDCVAERLNVARAAAGDGEAAQLAGYDSLVTCYVFVKLREICFDDDGKVTSVDGILAEITAF